MMRTSAQRGAQAVLAVGLILHALFLASLPSGFLNGLFVEACQGHGQASDFFGIYQAGANLLHGYSIYDSPDYRHEAPQVVPFSYFYRYLPPTAGAAALAAAWLAPWTAYWLWVVANEILMAVLVLAVLRDRRWPPARRWIAAGLWLGCFPFYIEQFMGQFSFTMAALLYALWRWDTGAPALPALPANSDPSVRLGPRAREWLVTAAWTASVTLKSFTVLLALPYLRDGLRRRVVAGAALGLAVCAPYFLWRPADVVEFLRLNLSPFMAIYKGAFGLQTALRDLVSHLPAAVTGWSLALAGRTLNVERAALLGASGVVLLLGLWASFRWSRAPRRRTLDIALWTTVFFLVFKSVWEYHYVMMLPVITALYCVFGSRWLLALGIWLGLPTLYAAAPVLAGVPASADLAAWPAWFRVAHFQAKVLPAVLVFIWLMVAARRRGVLSPAADDRA